MCMHRARVLCQICYLVGNIHICPQTRVTETLDDSQCETATAQLMNDQWGKIAAMIERTQKLCEVTYQCSAFIHVDPSHRCYSKWPGASNPFSHHNNYSHKTIHGYA